MPTRTESRIIACKDSDTLYAFYVDSSADLYYKKSTDGGASFGSAQAIKTATVVWLCIWATWWTSGKSGTKIHIAYADSDVDDVFHKSLDTSTDSLSAEHTVVAGATITTTSSGGITYSQGDNIHIAFMNDTSGTFRGHYVADAADETTWTSKANLGEADNDQIILLPANLADPDDIWCLYWDISAGLITLKTYDFSLDSINPGESATIVSATWTTTSLQWTAAIRWSDGHIILVAWTGVLSTSDLVCFDITNSTTWTQKTDLLTNYGDNANSCGLLIDQNTDDLYVYLAHWNGTTALVRYFKSTDGGANWAAIADYAETAIGGTTYACMPDHGTTNCRAGCMFDNVVTTTNWYWNKVNSVAITAGGDGNLTLQSVGGVASVSNVELGTPRLNLQAVAGLSSLSNLEVASPGNLTLQSVAGVASLTNLEMATPAPLTLQTVAGLSSLPNVEVATPTPITLQPVGGVASVANVVVGTPSLNLDALAGLASLANLEIATPGNLVLQSIDGAASLANVVVGTPRLNLDAVAGVASLANVDLATPANLSLDPVNGIASLANVTIDTEEPPVSADASLLLKLQ